MYRACPSFVLATLLHVTLAVVSCGRSTSESIQPTKRATPPNVVLISIDTLRADHVGTYGYGRPTSPRIDEFAEKAVVFERAYGASYHTADSHMSLFTSVYPSVHRIRNLNDPSLSVRRLSERIPTFTEALQHAGYTTVGFHGGGNVSPEYGFDRGFDIYLRAQTSDEPMEWLTQDPTQPFFLFFHTYHLHDPYTPSPPFDKLHDPGYEGSMISDRAVFDSIVNEQGFVAARDEYWKQVDPENSEDLQHVIALYDGEINEADLFVMELVDEALRLFPDTIVIITSDHGEEFFEHGRFLHDQLYEECLRVPLIIKMPWLDQGLRIATPVSLIDIAPTVLSLLEIPAPNTFQGTALLDERDKPRSDRTIFSEKLFSEDPAPGDPRNLALISTRWKVIQANNTRLFDLQNDPDERNDISPLLPMAEYESAIDSFSLHNDELFSRYHFGIDEQRETLSEEQIEALRQLGYLE